MKKIFCLLLCICFIGSACPAVLAFQNVSSENLALNKPVTTNGDLAGHLAAYAVDGNLASGWSPPGNNYPYIIIDLESTYRITSVEFVSRQDLDQANSRENIEVRGSNDPSFASYTTLAMHTQNGEPIPFQGSWNSEVSDPGGYRYIQVINPNMGYIYVSEFRVYGVEYTGAEESNTLQTYTDVTEERLTEALALLSALGIVQPYKDGSFEPEEPLSRSEACDLIARLIKVQRRSLGETVFEDVPATYWGASDIAALHAMGIISGVDEGIFRPEDKIKPEQFLKMLFCALGYEMAAQRLGGYPQGYISLANSYKLLDLKDLAGKEQLLRQDAAMLLFKALELPGLYEQIKDGELVLELYRNETVLSKNFHVEKRTGRVTAVQETDLEEGKGTVDGHIEIDGVAYKIYEADHFVNLGAEVTYYLQYDATDMPDRILYMKRSNSSVTLRVDAEDIIPTGSRLSFSYFDENGNRKEKRIVSGAAFLYNRKVFPGAEATVMNPHMGYVELLDYDGDGTFDMVSVIEYESFLVNTVSVAGNITTIFDVTGKSIQLDAGDMQKNVGVFKADGTEVGARGLEKWDVAYVAASKDKNVIYVYVVDDKVSGKVEGITGSADKPDEITVDGVTYKTGSDYQTFIANTYDARPIAVGENVTLCLDIYGKVAAHFVDGSTAFATEKYGYLLGASVSTNGLKTGKLKIFSDQGKHEELLFAEKYTFNGNPQKGRDDITAFLKATASNNTYGQPIVYKQNAKGEITFLMTTGTRLSDHERLEEGSAKQEYFYMNNVKAFFVPGVRTASFYLSDKTKIMVVPTDQASYPDVFWNEDYYEISSYSKLYHYEHYIAQAYNTGVTTEADLVVIYANHLYGSTSAEKATTRPVWVVERVTQGIDENGNDIHLLTAWEGLKKITYPCSSMLDFTKIKFTKEDGTVGYYTPAKGDVIRCVISDGKIVGAVLFFRTEEPASAQKSRVWDGVSYEPHYCRSTLGIIKHIYGPYMEFGVGVPIDGDIGALTSEIYPYQSAVTYVYDKQKKTLSVASAGEVLNYCYNGYRTTPVFAVSQLGESTIFVVVKD